MTRPRWCVVCGHLHYSETGLCTAHRDLVLDEVPADPIEVLPMQADALRIDSELGGGKVKPTGLVPPPPFISGLTAEAVSSLKGTERC